MARSRSSSSQSAQADANSGEGCLHVFWLALAAAAVHYYIQELTGDGFQRYGVRVFACNPRITPPRGPRP
jgi:hypothetical protein